MKRTQPHSSLRRPILSAALIGLSSVMLTSPVHADDEIRVGGIIQVPFALSANRSFFDPSTIRLGVTCQYAEVEEDEITLTHHVTNRYEQGVRVSTEEHTSVSDIDQGNRVYGVEGNLFVELFNSLNPSAELLGFYGNNHVQGALGAGYSLANDFFLDAKVMFPYSEIGIRFPGEVELYGGAKTLGDFNAAREEELVNVTTTITETTVIEQ